MDLYDQRPPLLYSEPDAPPADAWDLQIAAPPALVAWLQRHGPTSTGSAAYDIATQRAIASVAAALPTVPMRWHHHDLHTTPPASHPHLHVLVAAHDPDGRPVSRQRAQHVADEAWTAHLDRLVDYTSQRPHIGITWTTTGIAGIDHTDVPAFTCTEFYGGPQPAITGGP